MNPSRSSRGFPPSSSWTRPTLECFAHCLSLEYYPKGFPILTQGGPASDSLQVVRTGGAKVSMRSSDSEEIVIDYRSEGDAIGFLSLYSGDRSRTDVTAVEDTTCYLMPREPFLALLEAHPEVREYFHRTFLAKYMDKAFTDMRSRSQLFGSGEKLLFTTAVGDLITHPVVTASRDISIQAAAQLMSHHGISSLVLVDDDTVPIGIITDRDLRDKVAARGRDIAEPVANIMSTSLIKADAADYCFEALLTMLRHNIHHLLIVDEGRLRGIVTNHDLLMLQGTSPISVVREIEGQTDLDGLVQAAAKVAGIVGLLLKDGAHAGNITRIITEINDRLVRKVIEFALRKLGPAPLPWCWLAFGSEGRREQTFRTDQDNALVYADPRTPEEAAAARAWFPRFARFMKDGLVRCGFAACPANYMADNPRWNQPLVRVARAVHEVDHEPRPGGAAARGDPLRLPRPRRHALARRRAAGPPDPHAAQPERLFRAPGGDGHAAPPAARLLRRLLGRHQGQAQGQARPEDQRPRADREHRPPLRAGGRHPGDRHPRPPGGAAAEPPAAEPLRRGTRPRLRVPLPAAHPAPVRADPGRRPGRQLHRPRSP